jgi:hypothetical protein
LDSYLNFYEFNKTFLIENEEKAISNLYSFNDNIFELVINNFEKSNLEILIGGSSALASVVKKPIYF